MLPSLWKFLTNNRARTPRSRHPARGSTFQLTMEGLEDRLVPSTASQLGSTLNVIAWPGTSSTARTILLEVDQINPTKLGRQRQQRTCSVSLRLLRSTRSTSRSRATTLSVSMTAMASRSLRAPTLPCSAAALTTSSAWWADGPSAAVSCSMPAPRPQTACCLWPVRPSGSAVPFPRVSDEVSDRGFAASANDGPGH